MELNVIKLENDKEYYIIDTITYNEGNYLVLSPVNEDSSLAVRKVIVENGKELVCKLSSEEELVNVLKIFEEKHQG